MDILVCPWCLIPGEHREGSMRYTMVSPVEQRTSDRVKSEMHLATRFRDTINGLKGPSALMNLKESLLKNFVSRCEALYGVAFMTYNVHALLHLGNCARSLGPLWAHSAFVFEGGNGTILQQISAAKGLPDQIVERVIMFQQLQRVLASPLLASEEKRLCNSFLGYAPVKNFLRVDGLSLLGIGKNTVLSAEEQDAVYGRCGVAAPTAVEYERFVQKKQVFHSTGFRRPSKI
ncbi:hypothetical protein HPB49_014379 [Dermacentor silvarum]|uniref:Uncharacterized protein n=1 Tax=Dermacentor silvarum TaxID=543639 RepID=A0ACB8C484_DERSI|nr:hypothetical protein HPB49_014379 [Dermacentor silvarum]